MRLLSKTVGAFVALLAMEFSCSSNDESAAVECGGVTISFTTDVSPIIQTSCATNSSCHASGSNEGPGALITYAQIYSARTVIKSTVASGEMPKNGSLTSDQKNKIICWIENGAADN